MRITIEIYKTKTGYVSYQILWNYVYSLAVEIVWQSSKRIDILRKLSLRY